MESRKPSVFLSYARKDSLFARQVARELRDEEIDVWLDHAISPGDNWRDDIDRSIAKASAVIVILSQDSVESAYVTFEWAYGLGMGKTVIPIKLNECIVHPRLAPLQHVDFSVEQAEPPWHRLIARIREVDATVHAILNYLNEKGYQMVSYEMVREKINPNLTDRMLDDLIDRNRTVFQHARLKQPDRPGVGKRKKL